MNDKNKLELIDQMIANYYEFCSFDDQGMNAGSLQMLIGCIEAVIMQDDEEEEEECENPRCRHGVDVAACMDDCFLCPHDDEDRPVGESDISPETIRALDEFTEALSKYAALLSAIADEDE